jgi:hypothetical protein
MIHFIHPTGALYAYDTDGTQDDLIDAARAAGWKVATDAEIQAIQNPPPSLDRLKFDRKVAVQTMLDTQARSMGYDTIAIAVSYAEEPAVPEFQQEGIELRAWRSLVWAAHNRIMADVDAGKCALPDEAGFLAAMPHFETE